MATLPANRTEAAKLGYQYIGTLQGKDAAIKQYGSSRVKNIGGNYYVVPKGLTTPTPTTPIPVNKMTPYDELSKILGRTVKPNTVSSDIAGLLALQGSSTPESQAYDQLTGKLTSLQGQLNGQGTDLQNELNTQGVTAAYQQVKELTLKAAQLQGELGKFDADTTAQVSSLEGQPIPTGVISGQQAQLQKQRDLTRIGKASELSATIALNQAYQGNASLGAQLAQQAVDMKYQPILNEIETTKSQISIAGDKMSREDSKRAKIIDQLLSIKQAEIEDEKANKKQVQAIAIEAAGNGAPMSVINSIRNSSDPIKAAAMLRGYSNADISRRKTATEETGTPGFLNAKVESDIRADSSALMDQVDAGAITIDKAYEKIRRLYSGKEATDQALKDLLGITPAPAVLPSTTTTKKNQNIVGGFGKTVAESPSKVNAGGGNVIGGYAGKFINAIGKSLFGRK